METGDGLAEQDCGMGRASGSWAAMSGAVLKRRIPWRLDSGTWLGAAACLLACLVVGGAGVVAD
jgi:hypothetical protein